MDSLSQIYVYLLEEGTDVWRPVQAAHVRDDVYRIISSNLDPEDEKWQFASGELVRCEKRMSPEDGVHLVACERVSK
jgi:hypothetical protein